MTEESINIVIVICNVLVIGLIVIILTIKVVKKLIVIFIKIATKILAIRFASLHMLTRNLARD